MTTQDIIGKTEQFVLKTYGRKPLAFEKGEGVTLCDTGGSLYLDFASGLGVNALGYAHPLVSALIKKQADLVIHTSNLYHIPSQALLAEKICGTCFGERVFFCNSGTEAVEGALKFARKWGKKFTRPKIGFVAFKNSFHGRTMGALSATMQEKYQKAFEPLVPGFREAVFNDIDSVKNAVTDETAAVIIEPLQGEGGVSLAAPEFMKALETLCREREMLLIVDEVQCGMARTGKLHAYTHYDVTPDIMTLAKPLAGGLPIGAVVTGPRVWPEIKPGEHASTFGGNHFVTGVACGVFDLLSDPSFVRSVAEKGEYLRAGLVRLAEKYPSIKEIRGKGLLMGTLVEFPASEAVEFFEKEKILICAAGQQVVRFIPPLIVDRGDIDRVLDTFDRFLSGRT
ncbi:MAG: aspartate aminotransferase family protein [Candidatus Latescibacter sp.]|nr:aspartate aminotransferase family protein [Candidatus Latescibacter sp.]